MICSALHKEYLSYLKQHKDPVRAIKDKAYLYSDLKHYGLPSAIIGAFFKVQDKQLAQLKKPEVVKFIKYFWGLPSFEERCLAVHILNLHAEKLNKTDMPLIEKLMRESKGWSFLDSLIIPLMPKLLVKDRSIYKYLTKWIVDKDFWVRRSALLAQNLFFRKGIGGDAELFFDLARSQFDEKWIDANYTGSLSKKRARFFIRKAIGWALREMSGKNPNVVQKFLRENKGMMSGLSYKEGSAKLDKV